MDTFWLLPHFFLLFLTEIALGDITYRIINGEEIDISQAPYTVALKISSRVDRRKKHCSGAIIGHQEVLTAAHCFVDHLYPHMAYEHEIRIGSSYYQKGGLRRYVERVEIHPRYTNELNYDLAFVRVDKPFMFDANIQPIQIADSEPPDGLLATIIGWGETEPVWTPESSLAANLNSVNISLWHRESCKFFDSYRSREPYLYDGIVCVRDLYSSSKIPCRGDSGGPVVFKGQLIGIFSGALTISKEPLPETDPDPVVCTDPSVVGIYNSVVFLKPWIDTLVGISQSISNFQQLATEQKYEFFMPMYDQIKFFEK